MTNETEWATQWKWPTECTILGGNLTHWLLAHHDRDGKVRAYVIAKTRAPPLASKASLDILMTRRVENGQLHPLQGYKETDFSPCQILTDATAAPVDGFIIDKPKSPLHNLAVDKEMKRTLILCFEYSKGKGFVIRFKCEPLHLESPGVHVRDHAQLSKVLLEREGEIVAINVEEFTTWMRSDGVQLVFGDRVQKFPGTQKFLGPGLWGTAEADEEALALTERFWGPPPPAESRGKFLQGSLSAANALGLPLQRGCCPGPPPQPPPANEKKPPRGPGRV
eukprot:FR743884.1.p1 GENE.FR743884.1~~FR743884.1.p1  ORF type:complete len:308 (+),score=32.44 FR743884.1:88-924(+)